MGINFGCTFTILFNQTKFTSMENLFTPPKTVKLKLVGLDGNAFSLMGAFQRQAKKEGWTATEIAVVLDACRKSDYDNLLRVLMAHCE